MLKQDWLDRAGAVASTACAVHCVGTTLALAFLPVLGWEAVSETWLEPGLVLLAVSLALLALVRGYARHRQWRVAALFVAGLAGVLAGHWLAAGHVAEPWIVTVGGLCLALSHWRNRSACAMCVVCAAAPREDCACGDH
jgi:hypothetical protein